MKGILEKVHIERYVSIYIILVIDMAMSVAASMLSLVSAHLLHPAANAYDVAFAAQWLVTGSIGIGLSFYAFKTYYAVIRHSNLREISGLVLSVSGKVAAIALAVLLFPVVKYSVAHYAALLILDWLFTTVALVLVRVAMLLVYDFVRNRSRNQRTLDTVLIYGVDDKAISFVRTMQQSPDFNVAGFLLYGESDKSHVIAGKHVFHIHNSHEFAAIVKAQHIDAIIFAHRTDARKEENRLLRHCKELRVKVLYSPSVEEVVGGKVSAGAVRSIKIEDLLGRPEINISLEEIRANFCRKTVMVTGGAGSIGAELCRQLASFGVRHLVLFDNAETPMHNIRLELEERYPELKFTPVIGDIRLKPRLDFAFRTYRPQVVFHAAAYKHVPLMEENPCEAVLVNVAGTRFVADKCIEYGVEKMVMVSTSSFPTRFVSAMPAMELEMEKKISGTSRTNSRFSQIWPMG